MDLSKIKSIIQKKEFKNSAWNMADIMLLPFLMLLFTPFFINKIGADQYGIWMFVNSIIASIGVVNMGLGDATIKFVSKYKSVNDLPNLGRIVNALIALSLLLLLVFIILGNGFALLIKIFNLFNLNKDNLTITIYTVQLGSVVFGLKQVEQVFLSVFKGLEKYDTSARVSIFSKSLLILSQFIVAYFGYFLTEIFIVSAVITFLVVCGELLYLRYKIRDITFVPSLKKSSIKEIFRFSSWTWIQSILSVIATHIDRLFVITFAGPTFLAYYALASNVGSQVHSVLTASAGWVFPKVSAKTERKEDTNHLYYKMQLLLLLLSISIFAVLLLFESVIFKTWLGQESYNNSILLIKIFLYLAFFNSLSIIPYYFMLGSNLIKQSTIFMMMSLLFTVGFMIIGFKVWGTNGLAYGKLISSLITIPVILIFLHNKIINRLYFKTGFEIYLPAVLFAASVLLLNYYSVLLVIINIALIIFLIKKLFK